MRFTPWPPLTTIIFEDLSTVIAALTPFLNDQSMRSRMIELAALNGRLDILRFVYDHNEASTQASSALQLAVDNGRLDIVRFLHQSGADLLAVQTPLMISAAFHGHLEVLTYLHQNGCDLVPCVSLRSRLISVPKCLSIVHYLQASGLLPTGMADARLASLINEGNLAAIKAGSDHTDIPGLGPVFLTLAAKHSATSILQYLIENGATFQDQSLAVLTAAIMAGQQPGVKWVSEHTPLSSEDLAFAINVAAEHGHTDMVLYLHHELGATFSGIINPSLRLIALNDDWETFDVLTKAGLDGILQERAVLNAMVQEIMAAAPIYHPSKLWVFFNAINLEQLRRSGLMRFKRSVNQNYFNYIPRSLNDKQIRSLSYQFLKHPGATLLGTRMKNPDRYPLSHSWLENEQQLFNFSATSTTKRVTHFVYRQLYRIMVSMLWHEAERQDVLQLRQGLSEPWLGSPIELWYRGRLISQDLANSLIECNTLLRGMDDALFSEKRVTVAEIGSGYGRVGDVLLSSKPLRYVVFDIPPSLYLAQWYLGQRHATKRHFTFRHFDDFASVRDEFDRADIAFCSINQIELIPEGYFDLVINISSLHEMHLEQMHHILGEMYRIANLRVYLKQYRNYLNPYDGITMSESAYFVPEGWEKTVWAPDPNDARNFEALLTRPNGEALMQNARSDSTTVSYPKPRASIAILLTNFNDGRFLRTALDAILSQTDAADEIILVDDGSSDDSQHIMLAAQTANPAVRIIHHQQNFGQHLAIQRALLAATADYIVWAAADDLLLPDFIAKNRAVLSEYPEAGLSFSRLATFKDGGNQGMVEYTEANHGVAFDLGKTIHYHSPNQLAAGLRHHYLWMSGNTVVVRRSILLTMGGFPRDLRWHSDWFAYYRIALRHGAISIPETLALMRERPATYSQTGMNNVKQQKQVLCALIRELKRPCNLDLLAIFRACPSLFSPFGKTMLIVGLGHVQYWQLGLPLLRWYAGRRLLSWRRRGYSLLHRFRLLGLKLGRLK